MLILKAYLAAVVRGLFSSCPKFESSVVRWWFVDGASVVRRWCVSGASVVCRWCVDGASVVRRWCVGGASVVRPWCVGGASVVRRWCVGGASMVRWWCVSGASVVRRWCAGGASVILAEISDARAVTNSFYSRLTPGMRAALFSLTSMVTCCQQSLQLVRVNLFLNIILLMLIQDIARRSP